MFSKKKSNLPDNPTHSTASLPGGRSLFAPGLNPQPSHLTLDQPISYAPAPQTDWSSPLDNNQPFSTDVPAPPPLQWEPLSSEPAAVPANELTMEPTVPEVMQHAWQPEVMPVPPIESSVLAWSETNVVAGEPIMDTTTFDEPALTTQPSWEPEELPPLAPELYQPIPEPIVSEIPMQAEAAITEPLESIDSYLPFASIEEVPPLSWETPSASFESTSTHEPETAWNAWETSMTSAEGTMDPAVFLDTVNQNLYPEDPFTVDSVGAVEGAQAFEEAAQFLFPETVSSLPDLQPEEPLVALDNSFAMDLVNANPLELGSSYQPEPGSLNDLSALDMDTVLDTGTFIDPFEIPSVPVLSGEEPPDFGLPGLSSHQAILSDPALSAAYEMGDEGPELPVSEGLLSAFDDAYAFSETEAKVTSSLESDWAEAALWDTEIEPALPEGLYIPPESVEEDYIIGGEAWRPGMQEVDELTVLLSPVEPELPQPSPPANSLDAFLNDDDDFYASSFTLTEQGDVIPAYDPPPAQPILQEPVFQEALLPKEQLFQSTQAELNWAPNSEEPLKTDDTWFVEEPLLGDYSQPAEDFSRFQIQEEIQPVASVGPLDSAESLWNAPSVGEAQTSEPIVPALSSGLSIDQLEILGICPLTQDKRLLLVQSNGQFALMGQSGFENPNVSVLKIFEGNPVAYQQTFAAAQEGQAGEQGMFVTQVGTWHAIVSTFQDQIVLHTELG